MGLSATASLTVRKQIPDAKITKSTKNDFKDFIMHLLFGLKGEFGRGSLNNSPLPHIPYPFNIFNAPEFTHPRRKRLRFKPV